MNEPRAQPLGIMGISNHSSKKTMSAFQINGFRAGIHRGRRVFPPRQKRVEGMVRQK